MLVVMLCVATLLQLPNMAPRRFMMSEDAPENNSPAIIRINPPPPIPPHLSSNIPEWYLQKPSYLFTDRLITIFGLESSGTTFLAETLSTAAGIELDKTPFWYGDRKGTEMEVQHVSLPWGHVCANDTHFVEAFALVPRPCLFITGMNDTIPNRSTDDDCNIIANLGEGPIVYPERFFVDIVSHVRWYRSLGVKTTAVVAVRESTLSFASKMSVHCTNSKLGQEEVRHGQQLIKEAINTLSQIGNPPELVLVSYESLMALKETYLFDLYRKLGIQSDYIPNFKDGNQKYINGTFSSS